MNTEKNVQTLRKKNMIWIWLTIILIIAIIGSIGCFIYFSNKKDSNETNKNGNIKTFSPVTISGVRIESQTNKVIKSQEEWSNFLSSLNKRNDITPEINVDFATQDLVIIAMGTQSSGGYSVEINKVIEYNDQIVVYAIENSPGFNCATTSVISYPSQFVTTPKTNKPVKFEISKKINQC